MRPYSYSEQYLRLLSLRVKAKALIIEAILGQIENATSPPSYMTIPIARKYSKSKTTQCHRSCLCA